MVLLHSISTNEIYLPTEFYVDTSLSFRVISRSSKCKNEQRAITSKLGKAELRFLSTALLPNEVYLPTKFHVDISNSFRVMFQTMFKVKTMNIGQ
jgi:hypothetical protein